MVQATTNIAATAVPSNEPTVMLSNLQVHQYLDDGYVVIPNLLRPEEIKELRQDIVKVARGAYPNETFQPLGPQVSDQEVLQKMLCLHQPHAISPVMEHYAKHPAISRILGQIVAAHLPWWDGSVKCMQSMFFIKPPGFQGQAWHQDEIYIPTRDRSLTGAWIALDDATRENGCLTVLPGSHRTGYLYPQHPHNHPEEFDISQESYGDYDQTREVYAEVTAGSVIFFNGYLLHRSHKNRSAANYRRAYVCHYMNAWSLLPWSIQPGESPANADRRGVMLVAGKDPYAWKGYTSLAKSVHLRARLPNAKPAAQNT